MAFLKNKKLAIILIPVFFCNVFSQEITLDLESITKKSKDTSEVKTDKKSKEKTGEKPNWAASGLNLLVPGTGYFYLGEKKPAIAFLTADLTLCGGFLFTHFTSVNRYKSSVGFARIYAHTQSNRKYDDQYWSYLANGNFMKTEDFNWAMLNNREIDKTYYSGNDEWSWDSEESRDEFAKMRKKANHWKTASTLILGSMALNRVISFVTARVATKRYNDRLNFSAPPVVSSIVDFENKSYGVYLSWGI